MYSLGCDKRAYSLMSFCLEGVVVGRGAIGTLLLTRTKMTSLRVWRCYLKEVSDIKGLSLFAAGNSFPNLILKYVQEAACANTTIREHLTEFLKITVQYFFVVLHGLHTMDTSVTSGNITFSIDQTRVILQTAFFRPVHSKFSHAHNPSRVSRA